MNKNQLAVEFQNNKANYDRLGNNIVQALKTFLNEKEIPFLDIYYRIKKFDSFYEKIGRKKYKNPFEEIEDICGIRIICYYASDIEKISKLITDEFKILQEEDKADLLGLKEFAYRSRHFILRINKKWTSAPNYRNLEKLKAEVQVRTILMHAWAEIEHKLNYKSDSQVPDKFQRKLFRLSAKFEEADEQFEELKSGIESYKSKLQAKIESTNSFNTKQDFNIDTYRAFINFHFPDYKIEMFRLNHTFELYTEANYDFDFLQNSLEKVKPYKEEILKDLLENGYCNEDKEISETEVLGIALDIFDQKRFKRSKKMKSWSEIVEKWKNKITAGNNV